jgi:hypothetical protein
MSEVAPIIPTLVESDGFRVPTQNIKNFTLLNVDLNVATVFPLDALRRLIPSVELLAYSKEGLF